MYKEAIQFKNLINVKKFQAKGIKTVFLDWNQLL